MIMRIYNSAVLNDTAHVSFLLQFRNTMLSRMRGGVVKGCVRAPIMVIELGVLCVYCSLLSLCLIFDTIFERHG